MFSRNELIQRYSKATNRSSSALTDRLHSHQQLTWTDGLTPRDRNAILISQTAQFWKEIALFAFCCKGCSLARVVVSPSGPQLGHFTPQIPPSPSVHTLLPCAGWTSPHHHWWHRSSSLCVVPKRGPQGLVQLATMITYSQLNRNHL